MRGAKKSFHVQMKVKMAVVARAGTVSGSTTRKKIWSGVAPSMYAASSSSRGMPRTNWTIRNTKNASVARNLGTTSGRIVFTHPSCWKNTYWGITTTW